jgi:hypothetical protein
MESKCTCSVVERGDMSICVRRIEQCRHYFLGAIAVNPKFSKHGSSAHMRIDLYREASQCGVQIRIQRRARTHAGIAGSG